MSFTQKAILLLAACSVVSATPHMKRQTENCTSITQRLPWTSLGEDEKLSYLQADLCLTNSPSKTDFPGAVTRWDDLQWPHVHETVYVHRVGAFLPFHRYYMTVHEQLIRSECNYTGRMPYWDELAEVDDLFGSELFLPQYFGGDGSGRNSCITDGPFVNLTLRFESNGRAAVDHCVSRRLNQRSFSEAAQANIDQCMAIDTYADAWICWSTLPHNAGHGGVGGIMLDMTLSPGDPLFYLHHSYLDKLWWEWQKADFPARLTDMGGPNIPRAVRSSDPGYPPPAVTNYWGDSGNVTTLDHVLWMTGIAPNVTIGDIMNLNGPTICAEYLAA